MMRSVRLLVACILLGTVGVSLACAGGAVIPRQTVKGTVLIVSNLERSSYEDWLTKVKPKYLLWVSPDTDRASLTLPPGYVPLVLFLIKSDPKGVALHPSWEAEFPGSPEVLSRTEMMIASKSVPGEKPALYSIKMLITAPTKKLVDALLTEATALEQFPLAKPITHPVADLRRIRAIACLPSLAERAFAGVGNAAESALYRGLVELRAFQVVGREAMSASTPSSVTTLKQIQDLARELKVQALAFATITDASTKCREHTEFKKSSRTMTSQEAQQRLDDYRADQAQKGRSVSKKVADPDLVWAAPYQVRHYTTSVTGEITVVDAANGERLISYKIEGSQESEEEDEVKSFDYRWYKIDRIDNYDAEEDEYEVRLRATEAMEIARRETAEFCDVLAMRAMLPVPGEELVAAANPPEEVGATTAKILVADGQVAYIAFGKEQGARLGDTFSVWVSRELRDPDTGKHIETIRTRVARLKVAEVFEKSSRCDIIEQTPEATLQAGQLAVLD
jgi:hypothetical protein